MTECSCFPEKPLKQKQCVSARSAIIILVLWSHATDYRKLCKLLQSRTSERQGRAIDTDSSASMEKEKARGVLLVGHSTSQELDIQAQVDTYMGANQNWIFCDLSPAAQLTMERAR